jgi:hypothetical protein
MHRDGASDAAFAHRSGIWPRRRSTAVALTALVAVQAGVFFAATQQSFFTHEDFYHFALAGERHFLYYLVTPIIHTYPAPGHRLLFFLLHELFPLNYVAARIILLAMLAATTVLLGSFVRTLARSEQWWTVALLAPFALSLTLVGPVNLWSNGVPVIPALLFTVVALIAWTQSYTGSRPAWWVGVTVVAIAAAGTFYTKFLLIPMYLAFFRVVLFPRLLGVPADVRTLWSERVRWVAVCTPPALFLAVYILSGLAARSYIPGERPYLEYLVTAWFGAFVPISMLNVPLEASTPSAARWAVVVTSQLVFWTVVAATWRRSSLALRGWALLLLVFVTHLVMVGSARLPGFGVSIAYWLRYYPEIVFFLPIVLALGLRQGAERHPGVAWERTRVGRGAIAALACVQAIGLAAWAPGIVRESEGALAKAWFENFRRDVATAGAGGGRLRIVDSETPEYIVLSWMEPRNRISVILRVMGVEAEYNDLSGTIYAVSDDGRLREARFRPYGPLLPDTAPTDPVDATSLAGGEAGRVCVDQGGGHYRAEANMPGERLAVRVAYAATSRQPAVLEVDTGDEDRPYRYLQLRPSRGRTELIDMATSRVRALTVKPSEGDTVCIERLEMGALEH